MAALRKVEQALSRIRQVISEESIALSPAEWRQLRDELEADAEGWRMERQEDEDEQESED